MRLGRMEEKSIDKKGSPFQKAKDCKGKQR